MVCMVAYRMAFFIDPLDDIRTGREEVADYEKGGWRLVLFQGIQHRLDIPIFVTAVKGQIKHLFLCIFSIVGIVFF